MEDKSNRQDLCHTEEEVYYRHTLKELHGALCDVSHPTGWQSVLGTPWTREFAVVCSSKAAPPVLLTSQIEPVVAGATTNAVRWKDLFCELRTPKIQCTVTCSLESKSKARSFPFQSTRHRNPTRLCHALVLHNRRLREQGTECNTLAVPSTQS